VLPVLMYICMFFFGRRTTSLSSLYYKEKTKPS
jgi:hypothetical protein